LVLLTNKGGTSPWQGSGKKALLRREEMSKSGNHVVDAAD
jgi:hypothetical protein